MIMEEIFNIVFFNIIIYCFGFIGVIIHFWTKTKQHNRELKESFWLGMRSGTEEGFEKGMKAHTIATSELTEEEDELVLAFLLRHNIVMCYSSEINGFRLRRNDKLAPQKPKVISIVTNTKDNIIETATVTLIQKELMDLSQKEYQSYKQD